MKFRNWTVFSKNWVRNIFLSDLRKLNIILTIKAKVRNFDNVLPWLGFKSQKDNMYSLDLQFITNTE